MFILAADGRDDDVVESFRRYQIYLEKVREYFPDSAYKIANSEWYYAFGDHRCPHDGWLQTPNIRESSSRSRSEDRILSIEVRLLGAYHDRIIKLHYPKVFSHRVDVASAEQGHRDWRYDELRFSERGYLIHEIEWCGPAATGSWIIEASDLEIDWVSLTGEGQR